MKTRMEHWRDVIFIAATSIVAASIIVLVGVFIADCVKNATYKKEMESRDVLPVSECYTMTVDHPEAPFFENANESYLIEQSVIAQIGTETEEDCFGYSFTTLLQIITHEGNNDYETCWATATCCFTACVKYGAKYDPVEVCEIQQFAKPLDYYTDEALEACVDVFVRGNLCKTIEDATVFHSLGRGNTNYHDGEGCDWVCNINGVDYYRELKNWNKDGV